MTERISLADQIAKAWADAGWAAAISVLIGGALTLAAATVRKAFTNEAAVNRIQADFKEHFDKWERKRAEDRQQTADGIHRLEAKFDGAMHEIGTRIDGLYDRNERKDRK